MYFIETLNSSFLPFTAEGIYSGQTFSTLEEMQREVDRLEARGIRRAFIRCGKYL